MITVIATSNSSQDHTKIEIMTVRRTRIIRTSRRPWRPSRQPAARPQRPGSSTAVKRTSEENGAVRRQGLLGGAGDRAPLKGVHTYYNRGRYRYR